MDILPPLAQLISSLLVPVEVKVALVMHLEHALADGSRPLQLILHVVEHLLLLVYLCLPLLHRERGRMSQNKSEKKHC